MKQYYTRGEMILVIIALMAAIIVAFSLSLDLHDERNNNRTMSRMLYELGKYGQTNRIVIHEKK